MTDVQYEKLQRFAADLIARMGRARVSGDANAVVELKKKIRWAIDQLATAQFSMSRSHGLGAPGGLGCSKCTVSALAAMAGELRGAL
jgi:hypothetical protein